MNRKGSRPQLRLTERKEFARQFNNHLVLGQRPTGRGTKWENREFADELYTVFPRDSPYTEASVRGWRNVDAPGNPDRHVIGPILDTLFGNNPAFAEQREQLHNAWRRANGLREPEPPEPSPSSGDWTSRGGFATERLA